MNPDLLSLLSLGMPMLQHGLTGPTMGPMMSALGPNPAQTQALNAAPISADAPPPASGGGGLGHYLALAQMLAARQQQQNDQRRPALQGAGVGVVPGGHPLDLWRAHLSLLLGQPFPTMMPPQAAPQSPGLLGLLGGR